MKPVAILLVAWCLTGPLAMLPAVAAPDEKAAQRAMEQQRKAAEAEIRRQAEYERKVVEQQNRAVQEQVKLQQKAMQEQQRAVQNQQKALQNQQKTAQNHQPGSTSNTSKPQASTSTTNPVKPPHITTTQTATPVYHAARPYYSSGHAYHRTTYHNYRTTLNQNPLDPQTRALLKLKASLDHVRVGSPVTQAETTSIKRALMGVVNVPRVPTLVSIETLANHLAQGLANRAASTAQTGPMALTLMAALNSTEFANAELTEIMNEHRSALKVSKVRTSEITPIMESLKTVANQERSRR